MPAWIPDDRDALWWYAQDLAAIFAKAEQDLTRVLASELRGHLTDDPEELAQRVTRFEKANTVATRIADALREQVTERVPQILAAAAQQGASTALREVAKAAGLPSPIQGTPIGTRAVTALAGDLTSALGVVTQRVLRYPDDVWRRTIGQTSTNVLLGLDTGRQAQARAWQNVLTEGVTFIDKANRRWNTATYTEMATRTATRRAWEAQHTETMAEHGINLVTIVIGSRACEKCAAWDGKILRTDNGPTGPIEVERADGDGTMIVEVAATLDQAKEQGWHHPNCRCRPVAYLPGISKAEPNTNFDPEGAKNEQELRRLEREVRKAKMEEAAALTPEQAKAARAKVRARQAQIREHVDATGVPRRREREQLDYGHKVQVDGKQAQPLPGLPSMGERHRYSADPMAPASHIPIREEWKPGVVVPDERDLDAWKKRRDALPFVMDDPEIKPREIRFAERMLARGEDIEWLPLGEYIPGKGRKPSNDFVWLNRGGIHAEQKGTKAKYQSIKNHIHGTVIDARKHHFAKDNFVIDIGNRGLTSKLRGQLERYNSRTQTAPIKRLWVLSEDGARLDEIVLRT